MPLGLDPGTIAAGASVLKTILGPGGGGGQMPSGGPTFQQQFTPQFSPVMQQQQESPGGTQAASPTQYATGSQTATPGGVPGQPSITPYPSPLPLTERATIQTDSAQQYLKWGVIGLIGVVGIKAYQNKKRRK